MIDFDVEQWVRANWDPDITVAAWWDRLAVARLSHPALPPPWGRGWGKEEVRSLDEVLNAAGALGPPVGLGLVMTAPTLLAHARADLVERLIPAILNGRQAWCQLFSEPGAGSDLAGVQTRAERRGNDWVVTGQKVWTSLGQWADYGMLLARTDTDAPKHRGLTYFALPMRQAGVEVRPLREMTGRTLFNEVFLTEARVPTDHVVGAVGGGWAVANTTLMAERNGVGGGAPSTPCGALAGGIAGHLGHRAGSYAGVPGPAQEGVIGAGEVAILTALARQLDRVGDAAVRQDLARLHTMVVIADWHAGSPHHFAGNLAKLHNSGTVRLARDLAGRLLGAGATVTGPASPSGGVVQELIAFSPAPSIFGGTDQVQRNILAERALGLPREPER